MNKFQGTFLLFQRISQHVRVPPAILGGDLQVRDGFRNMHQRDQHVLILVRYRHHVLPLFRETHFALHDPGHFRQQTQSDDAADDTKPYRTLHLFFSYGFRFFFLQAIRATARACTPT